MWATGPGQSPGFHSGCKKASHGPLPGRVTVGSVESRWGKKLPLNEADWQVGASMSVGITGGKTQNWDMLLWSHQVKGLSMQDSYLYAFNFRVVSVIQCIEPGLKWKHFVCVLLYLTVLTCFSSIHISCPEQPVFTCSLEDDCLAQGEDSSGCSVASQNKKGCGLWSFLCRSRIFSVVSVLHVFYPKTFTWSDASLCVLKATLHVIIYCI